MPVRARVGVEEPARGGEAAGVSEVQECQLGQARTQFRRKARSEKCRYARTVSIMAMRPMNAASAANIR